MSGISRCAMSDLLRQESLNASHFTSEDGTMRRLTILLSALGLAVLLAAPASARSPHQIDPNGVTPPLNPAFAATCWETGSGIICEGSLVDTYSNEDFGLRCGDEVILVSGTLSDHFTRWHTSDGRATRTFGNQTWTETWSLASDGTGPTLEVSGRSIRHYTYFVPGDPGQRQLIETGATVVATAPHAGVVFRDAGRITYEVGSENDFQNPIDLRGPHDAWTDWDAAVARACEILGA